MISTTTKLDVLVICLLSIFIPQYVNGQAAFKTKSFAYHAISSTPVNHLYPGKILGVTHSEAEHRIVSAQILKGELPEGMILFEDGTLAVKQDKNLTPGKYRVKVEFVDTHGNLFTEKIKFELVNPVGYTDMEASVRIAPPKFTSPKLTNHYKAGDLIAQFHDSDAGIKEAQLIKGAIPPGVMLVQNKSFIVTQPDQLKDGEYFCLFFLKDEKGGSSVLAVSLPVGLQVGKRKEEKQISTIKEGE